MKQATITQAKNQLSKLLDEVRAGETIVITDRGRPIARLVPEAVHGVGDEGRVARLERAGVIRRGKAPPGELTPFPPGTPTSAGLRTVLEEREEGW